MEWIKKKYQGFLIKYRLFLECYRQYRKSHGRWYSIKIAYEIGFGGLPF